MRTFTYLSLMILFCSLISCDKNEDETTNNLNVNTYIELLKNNQYNSLTLPEFTYNDIPALLQYRNDNQIITNFPHNPISSLYEPECRLGMYVLWTVESIRAVSVNSENLIMNFPSQNPTFALQKSSELCLVPDSISHTVAAKAYYEWWENNKNKDFNKFKNINPLKDTNYKWN